jgi:hypothetical protein
MEDDRRESDQLPEEQPEEGSPHDTGKGKERSEANENPGGADSGDEDAGDATGNPKNAG